jgi:hypothetical protein
MPAEVPRSSDQVEPLLELVRNENSERSSILSVLLNDDSRAGFHPSIPSPLRTEDEGLTVTRPKALADELVQIELQAVFKTYSLSGSSHFASIFTCEIS